MTEAGQWDALAGVAVSNFCRRSGGHVSREDREDYLQIARLAAWRAHHRFDPGRGMTYGSYLVTSCYRALVDALRGRGHGDWFASRREAQRGEYRPVTSLNVVVGHGAEGAVERQDLIVDPAGEDAFQHVLDEFAVDQLLGLLPAREVAVIALHDIHGHSLSTISQAFGVTVSRISRIRARGMRRLSRMVNHARPPLTPTGEEAR